MSKSSRMSSLTSTSCQMARKLKWNRNLPALKYFTGLFNAFIINGLLICNKIIEYDTCCIPIEIQCHLYCPISLLNSPDIFASRYLPQITNTHLNNWYQKYYWNAVASKIMQIINWVFNWMHSYCVEFKIICFQYILFIGIFTRSAEIPMWLLVFWIFPNI